MSPGWVLDNLLRMESTFVIARRSKCRQDVRNDDQIVTGSECRRRPNDTDSLIQSEALEHSDSDLTPAADADAEIVLI